MATLSLAVLSPPLIDKRNGEPMRLYENVKVPYQILHVA